MEGYLGHLLFELSNQSGNFTISWIELLIIITSFLLCAIQIVYIRIYTKRINKIIDKWENELLKGE